MMVTVIPPAVDPLLGATLLIVSGGLLALKVLLPKAAIEHESMIMIKSK
ncbi:MAG: hypothetical protein M1423_01915 [Acidobacteria bacterium]|nr:hypothetical protein [Acidobacteriota bacterium]